MPTDPWNDSANQILKVGSADQQKQIQDMRANSIVNTDGATQVGGWDRLTKIAKSKDPNDKAVITAVSNNIPVITKNFATSPTVGNIVKLKDGTILKITGTTQISKGDWFGGGNYSTDAISTDGTVYHFDHNTHDSSYVSWWTEDSNGNQATSGNL
jgi:hypothetical protein